MYIFILMYKEQLGRLDCLTPGVRYSIKCEKSQVNINWVEYALSKIGIVLLYHFTKLLVFFVFYCIPCIFWFCIRTSSCFIVINHIVFICEYIDIVIYIYVYKYFIVSKLASYLASFIIIGKRRVFKRQEISWYAVQRESVEKQIQR